MSRDIHQQLGELVAGQRSLCAGMEDMRKMMARFDEKLDETHDMVIEHRTTGRVLKWVYGAAIVLLGAVGVRDWFH